MGGGSISPHTGWPVAAVFTEWDCRSVPAVYLRSTSSYPKPPLKDAPDTYSLAQGGRRLGVVTQWRRSSRAVQLGTEALWPTNST